MHVTVGLIDLMRERASEWVVPPHSPPECIEALRVSAVPFPAPWSVVNGVHELSGAKMILGVADGLVKGCLGRMLVSLRAAVVGPSSAVQLGLTLLSFKRQQGNDAARKADSYIYNCGVTVDL
ncbi:unnamed protein product [Ectocarpus sp. 4 AP-2014]